MKVKRYTVKYAVAQGMYWMTASLIYVNSQTFLESLGFATAQVGLTLALANVCSMLVQPALAAALDRGRFSLKAVICALVGVAVALALFLVLDSPLLVIGALFCGLAICTMCAQPFLNAAGFALESAGHKLNFSLARGIGSACFAGGNIALGWLLEHAGTPKQVLLPYYILLNAALFFWTLYLLRGPKKAALPQEQVRAQGNFTLLWHNKAFLLMIIGLTLLFIQHNIINTYLWSITDNAGGDRQTLGLLLGLAAFCEVPTMLLFVPLERKFRVAPLLVFAALVQTIKSALLLFTGAGLWVLYLSQSTQMLAYALIVPCTAYWVNRNLAESDRVKGQAWLTASTVIAGIFSNLAGGFGMQYLVVQNAIWIGTGISALGTGCLIWGVVRGERGRQRAVRNSQ
ncbi:MAG: MFS transporter [Clostridiales bacterium]|nr:MFS transporter [Clostridiales bacterium]